MTDQIKVCENQNEPYCFISYSHNDVDRVSPILSELTRNGCRIWYDSNIQCGSEWADDLHKWLTHENCVKFIVFISKYSIASDNVQDEVHVASKYKKSRLVIYLEDVGLTGGMELHLDRWQSIRWYEEENNIFIKKMIKGIPAEAMKIEDNFDEKDSDFPKKYILQEIIGQGGSSIVYKAKRCSTNTTVTIKMANCTVGTNVDRVLEKERDTLDKMMNCPFIPKLIDFGVVVMNGVQKNYLVESYIEGLPLSQIRCQLSETDIAGILLKAAQVLQFLHKDNLNLVHGDIKPENIMIDCFNNIYLIDFGSCVDSFSKVRWGTTTFASPEIKNGEIVDERSDIYSLGMTMKYLLLKEQLQIQGIRFNEIINRPIEEISHTSNYLLNLIIEKMTDERIEKRFHTLPELINAVEEYRKMLPVKTGNIFDVYGSWEEFKKSMSVVNTNGSSENSEKIMELMDNHTTECLVHSALLGLSISIVGEESIYDNTVSLHPATGMINDGI